MFGAVVSATCVQTYKRTDGHARLDGWLAGVIIAPKWTDVSPVSRQTAALIYAADDAVSVVTLSYRMLALRALGLQDICPLASAPPVPDPYPKLI